MIILNPDPTTRNDETVAEDKPPLPTIYQEVPLSKWNDWRWQLAHRLSQLEDFESFLHLTSGEREGLSAPDRFRVGVTPYFASLMDPDDPDCPIRRQVIPTDQEWTPFEAEMVDSLAEDAHSPFPGLVHRYPDRVLMLVTTQCASFCRFCTRSRIVGKAQSNIGSMDFDRQISYITAHPEIRDVLISGGDPLLLADKILESLLMRLREIPHLEVIRMGTRAPVFLPQRITPELVEILKRFHPLWMNIHFNHPKEITLEVERALSLLADAGIPLGSQTVLLAGINDCPNIIKNLMHSLVKNRVRPYYLYQCDLVHGAGHFLTPVSKGIEIIENLRGHTSGFAVPTFVIDAPDGGGKVPLGPQYVISESEKAVVVRNYEGMISSYHQPDQYQSHDSRRCEFCRAARGENGQEGVAGILGGQVKTIAPEGWNSTHQRMEQIGTGDALDLYAHPFNLPSRKNFPDIQPALETRTRKSVSINEAE